MVPSADLTDAHVEVGPAQALVLYTDGVSEARRGSEFFGTERVEAIVTDLAAKGSAADISSGLADAAASFQRGRPSDDIAVVALKVDGSPAG
jgi:sigma-B regulation protein RsbU (phosphoserine phosphatase)